MNKEKAIKKINTLGKIGNIVAIVVNVFICIAFVGILIGTIAMAVLPDDLVTVGITSKVDTMVNITKLTGSLDEETKQSMVDSINSETSAGSLSVNGASYAVNTASFVGDVLNIATEAKVTKFGLNNIKPLMYVLLLQLVFAFVSVFFVGKLCKSFKSCSSPFDAKVIKAIQYLAYSIIPLTLCNSVTESLAASFNGVTDFNLSISITSVFVVLVLLALAYIFKYGAVLQEESDETL